MKRREFITLLGGTAAWPLAARAQQSAMPVIGYLHSAPLDPASRAGFLRGLKESGFNEDKNIRIEYRSAEGQYDRLPALVADLVHSQVAVIVATGGGAGLAARTATTTIPIVFTTGGDPIKEGLVTSINRPGGNATGVNMLLNATEGKKLGLLRELIPTVPLIAVLLNPNNPSVGTQLTDVKEAAHSIGQQIRVLYASSEPEINVAIETAVQLGAGALLVGADAFFLARRGQLVSLTVNHGMPAVFHTRDFAVEGGLMSYGTDLIEAYHQIGLYTARILNGERPADLPVISSIKFELVINLKTAKLLHLDVPPGLSSHADDVIE
jgi:putative ABC transport system substrate-binding protein